MRLIFSALVVYHKYTGQIELLWITVAAALAGPACPMRSMRRREQQSLVKRIFQG